MTTPLPLEGLYLHLVRSGFPVAPRDYFDALSALRLGYGALDRKNLHWLCETLWVRTDEERVRLDRVFREFPQPTPEIVEALTRGTDAPAATTPTEPARGIHKSAEAIERKETPRLEFVSTQHTGVALPRATLPVSAGEPFIVTPRLPVSLRSLVVTLRRFRLAKRSGPRTDLDIDATVAEQARRGILVKPVLLPARGNQARMVVAIDSSSSMTPWRPFARAVPRALERSQLGHSALFYFSNVPRATLFESERLLRPVLLPDAMKQHGACTLLILSDAGAARGGMNPRRVEHTESFLSHAADAGWWPVAWLNPLPRSRWNDTTAEHVAALPGLSMFELSEDGLVQAVDHLRGKQSRSAP